MNHDDLYWQAIAENQIKQDYSRFLQDERLERNSDSAQIFAMRRINNGQRDRSERELILLLVGELPFAYD